jgi:hypothetical protein
MPIGTEFEINKGVNAVKSSKDTVTLDNNSKYKIEPVEDNIKFVKVTYLL